MKIKFDCDTLCDMTEVAVMGKYIESPKEPQHWEGLRGEPRPRAFNTLFTMKSGADVHLKMTKEKYDEVVILWLGIGVIS